MCFVLNNIWCTSFANHSHFVLFLLLSLRLGLTNSVVTSYYSRYLRRHDFISRSVAMATCDDKPPSFDAPMPPLTLGLMLSRPLLPVAVFALLMGVVEVIKVNIDMHEIDVYFSRNPLTCKLLFIPCLTIIFWLFWVLFVLSFLNVIDDWLGIVIYAGMQVLLRFIKCFALLNHYQIVFWTLD